MTHRGPITTPGMTDHEILMELHQRMYVIEGACETMAAQQLVAARNQRMLIEHAARLLRAKEILLEALGRFALARDEAAVQRSIQQALSPVDTYVSPEMRADIERAMREMGH
jgi:hypothetical protein